MRSLATNLSVFAVLVGVATIPLAASGGSAFAAADFRRPGLRHEG